MLGDIAGCVSRAMGMKLTLLGRTQEKKRGRITLSFMSECLRFPDMN